MTRVTRLSLAVFLVAASAAADDAIRFEDVSKAAGTFSVDRTRHPDAKVAQSQPNFVDVYSKGYHWKTADVTFLDADGDGNLDVFAMNAPHCLWSRLWLGDGKGGFTEVDSARLSPVTLNRDSRNWPNHWRVLACDLLGKGAQDLFITSDATGYAQVEKAGFILRCASPRGERPQDFSTWDLRSETSGYTLLLSDLDGDGCIDFTSGACLRPRAGYDDRVMFGTVIDGTIEQDRTEVPLAVGRHAIAADFDGDGLVDVLGRGAERVHLMRNLGRRRFADVTASAGLDDMPPQGPVAAADFNGDGRLDLYCVGAGSRSTPGGVKFYLNAGGGKFTDATEASGLAGPGNTPVTPSFGTATAADFDSDGHVDLLVCIGNENRLYRNLGGGKFADVTRTSGLPAQVLGESSNAAGDFDADGRVDLVVITRENGVGLFRNVSSAQNAWVRVKLAGPVGNPEAAGAQVTVYEPGRLGDRDAIVGTRELIVASEFKTPRIMHFGLAKRAACDVRVRFPGGKTVEKRGVAARSTVRLSFEGPHD